MHCNTESAIQLESSGSNVETVTEFFGDLENAAASFRIDSRPIMERPIDSPYRDAGRCVYLLYAD